MIQVSRLYRSIEKFILCYSDEEEPETKRRKLNGDEPKKIEDDEVLHFIS